MTLCPPTTPAEWLCLLAVLALCAGAAWIAVTLARSARVERRTQQDDEYERRGTRR